MPGGYVGLWWIDLIQCNPLNSLLRGEDIFFQITGVLNYQEPS